MKNDHPIVSIITPAYKCKEFIANTFKSINEQKFEDWEWIIVDDHSPDDTFDYIKKLTEGNKKVTVLQTKINSGAAAARNLGIEFARGRYIAFLDADDLFKPEKLEKQISFMKENNYAFTFTDYDLLYPNGEVKKHVVKHNCVNYKILLRSNHIGCLTAVYDTQIIGKNYMPIDCEKREDHGAWLDITKKGIKAYRLPESLSIYRISNNSVSSKKAKMMKYQYRLYRRHEGFGVFKSAWLTIVCSLNKIFNKY